MSNHIYIQLLNRKIAEFVDVFEHDSQSIFKNNKGKLIHPGEYGMYKEEAFKQLIRLFLDKEFSVGDGFIITASDKCSTQCDVVIYESNIAPLIQDGLTQFFPIEVVKGVCEIKSILSKSDFKEALVKLSKIKALSEELEEDFENDQCMRNEAYLPTFLVCNKLNFKLEEIDFEEVYKDISRVYWHNAILSLEDGIIQYSYEVKELGEDTRNYMGLTSHVDLFNSIDCGYPVLEYWKKGNRKESFNTNISREKASEDFSHIFDFLASVGIVVKACGPFEFNAHKYIGVDYKPGAINIKRE